MSGENQFKTNQSLARQTPETSENNDSFDKEKEIDKTDDQVNDNDNAKNLESKRRRSGHLNSSNEENSPKVRQEKKKSRIEQRQKMFEEYYPWVMQTYGDAAKTKTITIKKLNRIINALNGKETNRPDSSKFRFWVKTKGFTTIKPGSFVHSVYDEVEDETTTPLYVLQVTDSGTQTYKQVAVVEHFFDIIYNVHVGLGSKRCGRHAGQKRTYRTITETYAFLPREAVSKFLSLCNQCKKQISESNSSKNVSASMINSTNNYYDNNQYLAENAVSITSKTKHEKSVELTRYDFENDKHNWNNETKSHKESFGPHQGLFKPYENNNNKYAEPTPISLSLNQSLTYYQLLKLFYSNLNTVSTENPIKSQGYNDIHEKSTSLDSCDNIKDNNITYKECSNENETSNSYHSHLKIPTPVKSWNKNSIKSMNIMTSTPDNTVKAKMQTKLNKNETEVVKQMTSTYLKMTRSFGLHDDDALDLVSFFITLSNSMKLC
uniref:CSON015343 protein n=1 Tax=Culicoides sonorensis TaxID=179676 RepID=A0A336KST7_CULSO